ncbi:MAG: Nif11-like leader peptide family natural product precursor [Lachnospiraceae bacterium]|nr:Nif11-like leader peptide family natural product precursor [Lachnospiraceae bacterium]
MKEFLEAIEKNEELKAKIEALSKNPDTTVADFVALAAEYGFTLTEEDFTLEGGASFPMMNST